MVTWPPTANAYHYGYLTLYGNIVNDSHSLDKQCSCPLIQPSLHQTSAGQIEVQTPSRHPHRLAHQSLQELSDGWSHTVTSRWSHTVTYIQISSENPNNMALVIFMVNYCKYLHSVSCTGLLTEFLGASLRTWQKKKEKTLVILTSGLIWAALSRGGITTGR